MSSQASHQGHHIKGITHKQQQQQATASKQALSCRKIGSQNYCPRFDICNRLRGSRGDECCSVHVRVLFRHHDGINQRKSKQKHEIRSSSAPRASPCFHAPRPPSSLSPRISRAPRHALIPTPFVSPIRTHQGFDLKDRALAPTYWGDKVGQAGPDRTREMIVSPQASASVLGARLERKNPWSYSLEYLHVCGYSSSQLGKAHSGHCNLPHGGRARSLASCLSASPGKVGCISTDMRE